MTILPFTFLALSIGAYLYYTEWRLRRLEEACGISEKADGGATESVER